jgi:multisubunit Na+/H+ antiporter MnhC subunit
MKPLLHTLIFGLCLGLLLLAAPIQAQTENNATLSLENVPIQDEKILVVNIHLDNIEDLYGAEVQLRHDPTRLRVRDDNRRLAGTQISPGPLLTADDRFVVTNAADPVSGMINFVFTLLKPATPISGDGELATVVFEIIGEGPYSIEITNVQFVSSNLQAIPVTLTNLYLDEELEPITAAGNSETIFDSLPTGFVLTGIVLFAGVVGLTLIMFHRRRQATEPVAPVVVRSQPRSTGSITNSASLLAAQGKHALEHGDQQRAFDLFSRAIELDPANIEAWLGKALMADQPQEKRMCLKHVLALDPENQKAHSALKTLNSVA